MTKHRMTLGKAAVIGTIAAAAAGAVYLYGTSSGAKKRAKIKRWMRQARAEVVSRLHKMKTINQRLYHDIVEKVLARYRKIRDVDARELSALAQELKAGWRKIKAQATSNGHGTRRSARRIYRH